MSRTIPVYKMVVKTNRTHRNGIKNVQGGRIFTANIIQVGTKPARKGQMLTFAELRAARTK